MSKGRVRLLVALLVVAVVLIGVGIATIPVVDGLPEKVKTDNVIISGTAFILIFIGIIVAFIDFIIFLATRLNNNIPEQVHRPIERALIAGIVIGVVGMFQPFIMAWYTIGFVILLLSTLGYIVWSHIIPRATVTRSRRPEAGA